MYNSLYFFMLYLISPVLTEQSHRGNHVLLFGDSIDRYIVFDWCTKNVSGTKKRFVWGNESLFSHGTQKYIQHQTCFICIDSATDDSIANVHTYGSKAQGPYGSWDVPYDPFHDSSYRIPLSLQWYKDQFGPPDRVVLQTAVWDHLGFKENGRWSTAAEWRATLLEFSHNLMERLTDVKATLDEDVDVCLRTAASFTEGGSQIKDLNNVIRYVARQNNYTLLDLDYDIWSIVNFDQSRENELFRDNKHPRQFITSRVGEKILERHYSFYFPFVKNAKLPRNSGCDSSLSSTTGETEAGAQSFYATGSQLLSCSLMSIQLLLAADSNSAPLTRSQWSDNSNMKLIGDLTIPTYVGEDVVLAPTQPGHFTIHESNLSNLYFATSINGVRYKWTGVTLEILKQLFIGSSEMIIVSSADLLSIPTLGEIPREISSIFSDSASVAIISTENYLLKEIGSKHLRWSPTYYQLTFEKADRFIFLDSMWLEFLPFLDVIPETAREGALIREDGKRAVYVMEKGKARLISNGAVFRAHGWSFDDVLVITSADFNKLPIGPSLNN